MKWRDNNDVLVMSNCHNADIGETLRRQKNGEKEKVFCPQAILDYNCFMAGTDRCDQMATLYSYSRKSNKWWKKVFFRLFRIAIINTWILHTKIHGKKTPFFVFLMDLAHEMIQEAAIRREYEPTRTRRRGRPSKNDRMTLDPVGKHMIICAKKKGRWRCVQCSKQKKEKRVPFICKSCNVALCPSCFVDYHRDLTNHSDSEVESDQEIPDTPPAPQAPPEVIDLAATAAPQATSTPQTTSSKRCFTLRKRKVVQVSTFEEKAKRLAKTHNLTKDVAMAVIESARIQNTANLHTSQDFGQDSD